MFGDRGGQSPQNPLVRLHRERLTKRLKQLFGIIDLFQYVGVTLEILQCCPGHIFHRLNRGFKATAFSLQVLTERPHPTRLFLKKSRTSLPCPVQSRSENALVSRPSLLFLSGNRMWSCAESRSPASLRK